MGESGTSSLLIELGLVIVGMAILARIASRLSFSAIPLYLLAGLAFGAGGIVPLHVSEAFIKTGAEIGVLMLLFMLGLEYSGEELKKSLRSGFAAAFIDFVWNFPPGVIAGVVFGWSPLAAILLGGITYISSSSIAAKVMTDLRHLDCPETPTVLSILVTEDLAMAVYLPIVAALLVGGGTSQIAVSVALAVLIVGLVLLVAIRYGPAISNFAAHESDEIVLLSIFGTVLLVAGAADRFHVPAGVGAFLVGIAASGPLARDSYRLFHPLRDLFAATFFFFFGLQIDPGLLGHALPLAGALAGITAVSKIATGYWAAGRSGVDRRGRLRAGIALVARGEFSIVIAGLGSAVEPALVPYAAAYVLILAVLGPILAKAIR